jgi:hypothetical protein
MESYVKTNVTQFNPAPEISRMFRTGVLGTAAGFEWYRSNSLFSIPLERRLRMHHERYWS